MGIEIEILTRWKQLPDGKWITEAGEVLPDNCYAIDPVGQPWYNVPPDPNAVHLRIVADDEIAADSVIVMDETEWHMWGHGRDPDDLPQAAEFGQMVAKLAAMGIADGALISQLARTKTRRVNARLIRGWMKDRPKQQ